MKQSLRVSVGSVLVAVGTRVGAVILAIATMAAIVFALLNLTKEHGLNRRMMVSPGKTASAALSPSRW